MYLAETEKEIEQMFADMPRSVSIDGEEQELSMIKCKTQNIKALFLGFLNHEQGNEQLEKLEVMFPQNSAQPGNCL